MIDLFGLGKNKEPHGEQPGETPDALPSVTPPAAETAPEGAVTEPAAPRGSHKLWAVLLVFDSIFVIVFGGAVAAKIFQYWRAPAAPTAVARKRPVKDAPKPAEPAPVEQAAAPAPAPEPVKPAPEPPKPAPEPKAARVEAGRPPKPSLLSDAPKHRETPKLAGTDKTPAAPAPKPAPSEPGKASKAVPVEFKVRAPEAKSAAVVGAFIVRGGRRDMNRHGDGTWSVTLYLNPGQYRYFFSVDKKKVLDPENPHSERGASVLTVP